MSAAMRLDVDNELLKAEVREYWNAHPCGTQFTHLEWGSKEFFEEVERFRYETQPFMPELMEFKNFRGKKLLEVGCGLGTDLLQFARGGATVTGVDLTPRSIEFIKKRFALYGLSVDARVADAENLPFENNTFDVIYSFGVLHHTPNTKKAIDEIFRVLKRGGEARVMLYHKQSIHVWLGTLFHLVASRHALATMKEKRTPILEDWIRVYDGAENPLGKAYTRGDARQMFAKFEHVHIHTCDPVRRRFPKIVNKINQALFARRFGFYMLIHSQKAR